MTTPSKAGQIILPETCLRWSFDGNRARVKRDGAWVKYRDYEDVRNFANGRMCSAKSLEAELAVTRRALELAVKDVNDHLQENRAPGVLSAEDYLISARKERGQ